MFGWVVVVEIEIDDGGAAIVSRLSFGAEEEEGRGFTSDRECR